MCVNSSLNSEMNTHDYPIQYDMILLLSLCVCVFMDWNFYHHHHHGKKRDSKMIIIVNWLSSFIHCFFLNDIFSNEQKKWNKMKWTRFRPVFLERKVKKKFQFYDDLDYPSTYTHTHSHEERENFKISLNSNHHQQQQQQH